MISIATKKPERSLNISSAAPPAPSNEKITTHIFKFPDIPISNHLPLHAYCFQDRLSDDPCLIVGSNGKTYSYAKTHLICRKTAAGRDDHDPPLELRRIRLLVHGSFHDRTSGAKLIIIWSQYVDKLPKANKDFIVITVDAPSKNCLHFTVLSEANEDQIPEVAIKPDDLVVRKLSFLPRFLQENCQVTN
ncbi:hypothetical protein CUMW_114790 [Citrus unshiu]|nr:hypothetical protein CUMW_114790 [Citrus unshiu]